MAKDFVILCVCAGNIHRSALAEALMERWAEWYLPKDLSVWVNVTSAGLIAHSGAAMGEQARAIATALGAEDRARQATPLTDGLVSAADLVLTATRRQADEVVQRVPSALRTTFTMREAGRAALELIEQGTSAVATSPDDLRATVATLADRRHARAPDDDDVVDPQGRDDDTYLLMTRQEVPALARVAVALFGMSAPDLSAYTQAASDPASLLNRAHGEKS